MGFTRIRKKRKSVALYTNVNFRKNEPPVWRTKRYKRTAAEIQKAAENDNNILEALKSECLRRLKNKVMECLRENKEGISQLKEDCMNLNQIERGTLTAAETRADLPTTPITKYLHIKKEKSIDIWKQCVEDHFDDIVQELESEQAAATVTEQKHDPANKDTTPQNKEHQELLFKSCSASFSNFVRDDIETTIQQFIVEQLRNTIFDATDYATSFEMQILRYFLILKDHVFEADNKKIDDVKLVKVKNIDITEIIPQKFIRDDSDNLGFSLPPPLDKSVLNNDDVRKNYENLFSMSHFQLIHSTYFDPQGPKEATVNKKSCLENIF